VRKRRPISGTLIDTDQFKQNKMGGWIAYLWCLICSNTKADGLPCHTVARLYTFQNTERSFGCCSRGWHCRIHFQNTIEMRIHLFVYKFHKLLLAWFCVNIHYIRILKVVLNRFSCCLYISNFSKFRYPYTLEGTPKNHQCVLSIRFKYLSVRLVNIYMFSPASGVGRDY
jgi:hypothetical protein